jgi:GTPase SAR1 family protein
MAAKYNVAILGSANVGKKSLTEVLANADYQFFVEEFPDEIDGVIILFSVTDRASFEAIESHQEWAKERFGPMIPMVLCGNKVDRKDRLILAGEVVSTNNAHIDKTCGLQFVEISCKSWYHSDQVLPILNHLLQGEAVPDRGAIIATVDNMDDIMREVLARVVVN